MQGGSARGREARVEEAAGVMGMGQKNDTNCVPAGARTHMVQHWCSALVFSIGVQHWCISPRRVECELSAEPSAATPRPLLPIFAMVRRHDVSEDSAVVPNIPHKAFFCSFLSYVNQAACAPDSSVLEVASVLLVQWW